MLGSAGLGVFYGLEQVVLGLSSLPQSDGLAEPDQGGVLHGW